MKSGGDSIEYVSCAREEMVCLMSAQRSGERRHKDLHEDASEGATGFRLSEMADERRSEESGPANGSQAQSSYINLK